jgi:hypothetical protein
LFTIDQIDAEHQFPEVAAKGLGSRAELRLAERVTLPIIGGDAIPNWLKPGTVFAGIIAGFTDHHVKRATLAQRLVRGVAMTVPALSLAANVEPDFAIGEPVGR